MGTVSKHLSQRRILEHYEQVQKAHAETLDAIKAAIDNIAREQNEHAEQIIELRKSIADLGMGLGVESRRINGMGPTLNNLVNARYGKTWRIRRKARKALREWTR